MRAAPPAASRVGDLDRYAEAALDRRAERIEQAPPGEQCDTLDRQAYGIGRLVAGGVIPRGEARAALVAAGCRMGCQAGAAPGPGTSRWRVERALAAGVRNPRVPEPGR